MKKIILTFFIILSVFLLNKNTFSYYLPDGGKQISIQTKKTSILLKKHTDTLEKQLIYFQKKLDLENDEKINSWLEDLWKINKWLDAIKNDKVDSLKANILIKSIINRLKTINNDLKPYLKEKLKINQKEINRIKEKYNPILKIYLKKLQNWLTKIRKKLNKKNNLTIKDKNIIKHLNNIENYIVRLNWFKTKKFYNKEELKNFLIINLKWIINEINWIKKELN